MSATVGGGGAAAAASSQHAGPDEARIVQGSFSNEFYSN